VTVPPRLFGIPAADAPIVAVLRRGPSEWFQLGRWSIDKMTYEPGAWLRGRVYPQRCDLSPDGRYFVYLAFKPGSTWAVGSTYIAVSKLPWLHALAAWATIGTWSRGMSFTAKAARSTPEPDEGSVKKLPFGLVEMTADSFAVERRRGWSESPLTVPRAADDMWDERRGDGVVMMKPSPITGQYLQVSGIQAGFRSGGTERGRARYELVETDGRIEPLDDVQWADWSRDGRLLVATNQGELQIRNGSSGVWTTTWTYDINQDEIAPRPAPPAAMRW
jgi:hypothetical protein